MNEGKSNFLMGIPEKNLVSRLQLNISAALD